MKRLRGLGATAQNHTPFWACLYGGVIHKNDGRGLPLLDGRGSPLTPFKYQIVDNFEYRCALVLWVTDTDTVLPQRRKCLLPEIFQGLVSQVPSRSYGG